jgi:ATP-binding cassette, subfamily B, bacterial PglK
VSKGSKALFDNETEQIVMDAVNSLRKDLTILIIAYRFTTLKKCDQIIELGNSGILRTDNYKELVNL